MTQRKAAVTVFPQLRLVGKDLDIDPVMKVDVRVKTSNLIYDSFKSKVKNSGLDLNS